MQSVERTTYPCGKVIHHPNKSMKKPEVICFGQVMKKSAKEMIEKLHLNPKQNA